MQVEIKCKGSKLEKLENLNPMQGDLKDLSDANYEKLKAEIIDLGFSAPFFCWTHQNDLERPTIELLDGHQRYKTLMRMKKDGIELPDEFPIVEIEAKDYKQAKQKILALSSQYGTITDDGLKNFLNDIEMSMQEVADSFQFDALDLSIPEVEVLPPGDEDSTPEVQEIPITVIGDVWLLGNHRVMCGDSTSIDAVEKLMDGNKADMVFTSPPYNGDTHLDYGKGENKSLYENDTDKWTSDEYIDFCHEVLSNIFSVTDGFIFWNVMYNAKSRFEFIKCIYPYIGSLWETIAWKKTGMPISNGLTRNFEFIFCFKNGKRKHLSKEFKTESNLWDISNIGAQYKGEHRACFPVGLPEKGIIIGSEKGEIVFEPFVGSGTTVIACEKTNRKCCGMELDEKYCDLTVRRWQKYTNKEAILEGDDRTFAEIDNERN